ncbi:hypothetical protein Q3G72_014303 [Acer saccharum]|nr:hypothetical protein Q3G72_014303 [Acer saccharum]
MLKVVSSTSMNSQCIIILCFFLTFSVNINPVTSVAASLFDPINVEYKDSLYSPELNLSVRIYLPNNATENQKLPLLVYYHGGGFFIEYQFSPPSSNDFLSVLVLEANVIVVTVAYRLAKVCTLPCAYDDSWTALQWVASHLNRDGPEDWLNQHADFQRVFLSGDSAGANIAHQMALKLGTQETVKGFNVSGLILSHPYFWGKDPISGEITGPLYRQILRFGWVIACPNCELDDPWINPATDPNLARVATPRLQVFLSELDIWRIRGSYYAQKLKQSGWSGYQEVIEFKGEGHAFHLKNITSRNSTLLRYRMANFINRDWSDASIQSK